MHSSSCSIHGSNSTRYMENRTNARGQGRQLGCTLQRGEDKYVGDSLPLAWAREVVLLSSDREDDGMDNKHINKCYRSLKWRACLPLTIYPQSGNQLTFGPTPQLFPLITTTGTSHRWPTTPTHTTMPPLTQSEWTTIIHNALPSFLPPPPAPPPSSFTSYSPASIAQTIDHTLLRLDATESQIDSLCAEAIRHKFKTVCVRVGWVSRCVENLRGSGSDVGVCCVIGFHEGTYSTEEKVKWEREISFFFSFLLGF